MVEPGFFFMHGVMPAAAAAATAASAAAAGTPVSCGVCPVVTAGTEWRPGRSVEGHHNQVAAGLEQGIAP